MQTIVTVLFLALFFACGDDATSEQVEIQTCGEEKQVCEEHQYCGIDKYNVQKCVPFPGRCDSLTDCEPINYYYCDYDTKECKKRGNYED